MRAMWHCMAVVLSQYCYFVEKKVFEFLKRDSLKGCGCYAQLCLSRDSWESSFVDSRASFFGFL